MYKLEITKRRVRVSETDDTTSGSVGVDWVEFTFDESWAGLTKTAVFRAGTVSDAWILDSSNACQIPPAVTAAAQKRQRLYIGVFGTSGAETIMPTVWADCGTILEGVAVPEPQTPVQISAFAQLLANQGDMNALNTQDKTSLVNAINEVLRSGGGGGSGNVSSEEIKTIRVLDREEYEALPAPDEATLYLIRG